MQVLWEGFFQVCLILFHHYEPWCLFIFRSFVLTKHEKSHVIREELGNENSLDIVDSDTVLVEEIDYEDEESVKQATDLLLQRELGEEVF